MGVGFTRNDCRFFGVVNTKQKTYIVKRDVKNTAMTSAFFGADVCFRWPQIVKLIVINANILRNERWPQSLNTMIWWRKISWANHFQNSHSLSLYVETYSTISKYNPQVSLEVNNLCNLFWKGYAISLVNDQMTTDQ